MGIVSQALFAKAWDTAMIDSGEYSSLIIHITRGRFMKYGFLLVAVFMVLRVSVMAQVTIDRADIESQVGVVIESRAWDVHSNISGSAMPDTTGLAIILAGGDADFSTMAEELLPYAEFELMELPQDIPGVDSFQVATHAESFRIKAAGIDSASYRFLTLDDNGIVYHGGLFSFDTDQDGTPDQVAAHYEPSGWVLREFPFGTGSMWETSFTQSFWINVPVIGAIQTSGTMEEREYEVVGTTTLTTPAGSAEAVVAHIYEFLTFPMGAGELSLERYSFIAENGLAVTVAWEINRDSRERERLHEIAYFVPDHSSSADNITGNVQTLGITLDESYPNPVIGRGTIPFHIEQPGMVHLALYNEVGDEVAVLVEGWENAGDYTATFATDNLSSGTYTAVLTVGGAMVSRKVMVRK